VHLSLRLPGCVPPGPTVCRARSLRRAGQAGCPLRRPPPNCTRAPRPATCVLSTGRPTDASWVTVTTARTRSAGTRAVRVRARTPDTWSTCTTARTSAVRDPPPHAPAGWSRSRNSSTPPPPSPGRPLPTSRCHRQPVRQERPDQAPVSMVVAWVVAWGLAVAWGESEQVHRQEPPPQQALPVHPVPPVGLHRLRQRNPHRRHSLYRLLLPVPTARKHRGEGFPPPIPICTHIVRFRRPVCPPRMSPGCPPRLCRP
jgi:hypothetical protein